MNQENIKLVQTYYHLFNTKDFNAFVELLDEQVIHDINQGGQEIGKTAFRFFMDKMNTCYDEHISDLMIMTHPEGSRASAEFIVSGTYLASDEGLPPAKNQTYRLTCGAFFEIKNNKITRITNYYNMQEWLKQISG